MVLDVVNVGPRTAAFVMTTNRSMRNRQGFRKNIARQMTRMRFDARHYTARLVKEGLRMAFDVAPTYPTRCA
jgi:hypothetical protein